MMAHFESVAGGSLGRNPFYWNQRLYGADARRIIHAIRELAEDFECDENYIQGVAKRTLKLDVLPPLESLDYYDLLKVRLSLANTVATLLDRGEAPKCPRPPCGRTLLT